MKSQRSPSKARPIRESAAENWNRGLAELKSLLPSIRGVRVLVIGDVGIDRYTVGHVDRISPEAPVPILSVTEVRNKLGLAANVADNLSAVSANPILCGTIGSDIHAECFLDLMTRATIPKQGLVVDKSRPTTLKERIVTESQQLLRVDYESVAPLQSTVRDRLLRVVQKNISSCDVVIVQDYAKGCLDLAFVQKVLQLAAKYGVPVAIDPNSKGQVEMYRGAYLITPNLKEAEALSGIRVTDEKSLVACGHRLLELWEPEWLVITLGKDGMALFPKDTKKKIQIPTFAREVFDVSGAGDTVISLMALGIGAGGSVIASSVLGNIGAGIVVGKRGTATVSYDELKSSVFDLRNLPSIPKYSTDKHSIHKK